jgi:hypothetical protein
MKMRVEEWSQVVKRDHTSDRSGQAHAAELVGVMDDVETELSRVARIGNVDPPGVSVKSRVRERDCPEARIAVEIEAAGSTTNQEELVPTGDLHEVFDEIVDVDADATVGDFRIAVAIALFQPVGDDTDPERAFIVGARQAFPWREASPIDFAACSIALRRSGGARVRSFSTAMDTPWRVMPLPK